MSTKGITNVRACFIRHQPNIYYNTEIDNSKKNDIQWKLYQRSFKILFYSRIWNWTVELVVCWKQLPSAGISNYIPQALWDVITCPCSWYLLLAHRSSIIVCDSFSARRRLAECWKRHLAGENVVCDVTVSRETSHPWRTLLICTAGTPFFNVVYLMLWLV